MSGWLTPLAWAYFTLGRLSTHNAMMEAKEKGEKPPAQQKPLVLSHKHGSWAPAPRRIDRGQRVLPQNAGRSAFL